MATEMAKRQANAKIPFAAKQRKKLLSDFEKVQYDDVARYLASLLGASAVTTEASSWW